MTPKMNRLQRLLLVVFVATFSNFASHQWCVQAQESKAKVKDDARPTLTVKQKYRFARAANLGGNVDFSPDGEMLVGHDKGVIIIWEMATGNEKKRIACDPSAGSVAFLPDSKHLIWWWGDPSVGRTVTIWDIAKDRQISSIKLGSGETYFKFLPGGTQLLTFADGVVFVRDAKKGNVIRDFRILPRNLGGIIGLSADGKTLATNEGLKRITTIWNLESGEEITKVAGIGTALSSNGDWIAVADSKEKTIRICDAKSGKDIHKDSFKDSSLRRVFSADDKWLAIGSTGNKSRISIRDTKTFEELVSWHPDSNNAQSIAFNPRGNLLACTGGRSFQVWEIFEQKVPPNEKGPAPEKKATDAPKNPPIAKKTPPEKKPSDAPLDVKPEGKQTPTTTLTAREIFVNRNLQDDASFVGFRADDKIVVTASGYFIPYKRGITAWELKDGTEKWTVREQAEGRERLDLKFRYTLSPDGKLLVESGRDWLHVLNADNGKKILLKKGEDRDQPFRDPLEKKLAKIVFGTDPERFARMAASTVEMWRPGPFSSSRTILKGARAFSPKKSDLPKWRDLEKGDLSPDLNRIAAPMAGNQILVWDIADKKEICTMDGHKESIGRISYSPCGKWIVSTSALRDQTVYIWDANTGASLKRLEYPNRVWDFAFSPDGKWLACGTGQGKAGEVIIWEMPTGKKLLALDVGGSATALAFSKKGDMLAAACRGACHVWALKASSPPDEK
jgi:WD40 repeat protein